MLVNLNNIGVEIERLIDDETEIVLLTDLIMKNVIQIIQIRKIDQIDKVVLVHVQ